MKNRFFSGLLACIACLLLCTVAHAESDYGIYIYDYAIYSNGKNIRTDNALVPGNLKVSAVINNDTTENASKIAVIAAVFDTKDTVQLSILKHGIKIFSERAYSSLICRAKQIPARYSPT